MIRQKNKNLTRPLPQVIGDYTADYNLQYNLFIKPVLPSLVDNINSLARSQIIGMAHTTSITRLLLEGIQYCYCPDDFFYDLSELMDHDQSPIEGRFRDTVMALMFVEQKLAQANFYLYRNSQASKAILDKLPPNARVGSISAAAEGNFSVYIDEDMDNPFEIVSHMSRLLPDITSVVDALFTPGWPQLKILPRYLET
ncbi:hypothetical protein THAOC_26519, partial [Thalassiosira oceanica]